MTFCAASSTWRQHGREMYVLCFQVVNQTITYPSSEEPKVIFLHSPYVLCRIFFSFYISKFEIIKCKVISHLCNLEVIVYSQVLFFPQTKIRFLVDG